MVLAREVPLHATVSTSTGGLGVRTGASADPTSQDVALMSVSGHSPMLDIRMVSVKYAEASTTWSNQVKDQKYFMLSARVV